MDIIVRWDKMGSEFSYHVWYAKNPGGPWLRANPIRLTDDIIDILRGFDPSSYDQAPYNQYTITGLDETTRYSFKVTCEDRYYSWWYSYGGPEDLDGGLGTPNNRPSPDGGNIIGFQFFVNS
jgi:hypothetical protein